MPLIERAAKRIATIELGQSRYRFAPDAQGRFVCEVNDSDHADRLLSIEGYSLADKPQANPLSERHTSEVVIPPITLEVKRDEVEPLRSAIEDAEQKHGDDEAAKQAAIAEAKAKQAEEDAKDAKARADADKKAQDQAAKGKKADDDEQGGPTDRERLAAAFEKLTGKKPHGNLSAEKLEEIVADLKAKKG